LTFELGGATFKPDVDCDGGTEHTFPGRISQSSMSVSILSCFYYGFGNDLGEVLPDGSGVYTVFGTGTGSQSGGTIAVTLSGSIAVAGPHNTNCSAPDHRLTLTRPSTTSRRRR